jgi:hypothetical protein
MPAMKLLWVEKKREKGEKEKEKGRKRGQATFLRKRGQATFLQLIPKSRRIECHGSQEEKRQEGFIILSTAAI